MPIINSIYEKKSDAEDTTEALSFSRERGLGCEPLGTLLMPPLPSCGLKSDE